MLEVDSLDVVGRLLTGQRNQVCGDGQPGKTHQRPVTSFYLRTPSGCDLEYGVGGRLVDESWVPTWFRSPSIWGHRRLAATDVAATVRAGTEGQRCGADVSSNVRH